jgi:alcohol dehydrogenase class IV
VGDFASNLNCICPSLPLSLSPTLRCVNANDYTHAMCPPLGNYEFLAPAKIVFGWGRRREVAELARTLGRRAFIVWGSRTLRSSNLAAEMIASLRQGGIEPLELATISHEPLVSDVDTATWALHQLGITSDSLIIAIGGGSAIDLAKAIAAMATSRASETVQDYLEGVGRGLKIENPPLPMLAMPTTAGTGSEATKNSVISSHDPPFKKSLRSDLMLPRIVLVDPELTVSCPRGVTAHSGMDAITQCIESYVSRKTKPIASAVAMQGLQRGVPAIVAVVENGSSRPAREAMAHAALLSGMALANSGLGMAHGVAAALGVHCNIPHGLACAVMLPVTLRLNRDICSERLAELERAINPLADAATAADAFIHRMENLCDRIGIPRRLSELGVERKTIPALVAGSRGNSMDGNPRELNGDELTNTLEAML